MRHVLATAIASFLISFQAVAASATQESNANHRQTASEQSPADTIHALIHAGKSSEMIAKVDALRPDNPDWKRILELLMEAAERENDYSYLKQKAKGVLTASKDPETRATSAFALGMSCWRSGELGQSEAAFATVDKILPDSELAQAAAGNIHEIQSLGVGQPAPRFAIHTIDGAPLSSEELKGRVVLINFWASW